MMNASLLLGGSVSTRLSGGLTQVLPLWVLLPWLAIGPGLGLLMLRPLLRRAA